MVSAHLDGPAFHFILTASEKVDQLQRLVAGRNYLVECTGKKKFVFSFWQFFFALNLGFKKKSCSNALKSLFLSAKFLIFFFVFSWPNLEIQAKS